MIFIYDLEFHLMPILCGGMIAFSLTLPGRRVVKERIFYGLADRKRLPPLLQSPFCDFLGVFLTFYYDYMGQFVQVKMAL